MLPVRLFNSSLMSDMSLLRLNIMILHDVFMCLRAGISCMTIMARIMDLDTLWAYTVLWGYSHMKIMIMLKA